MNLKYPCIKRQTGKGICKISNTELAGRRVNKFLLLSKKHKQSNKKDFTEEEIKTTDKHMKSYSTSLVMSKILIETMGGKISYPLHQQKIKSHKGIINKVIKQ